jgi:hypothetical protein
MERWLGRAVVRAQRAEGIRPQGPKDAGHLRAVLDVRRPHPERYRGERGTAYYETRTRRATASPDDPGAQDPLDQRLGPCGARFRRCAGAGLTNPAQKPYRRAGAMGLGALEPYQPEYLAGFRAEAYQIELTTASTEARHKMDRIIELRRPPFDIGGDEQRMHRRQTDIGRHVQAYPAAGLAGGLQVPRRDLSLCRQRPHGRSEWRASLFRLEDRICGCRGPPLGGRHRLPRRHHSMMTGRLSVFETERSEENAPCLTARLHGAA